MNIGGSVSRRTRSRSEAFWAACYNKLHHEIKKESSEDIISNGDSSTQTFDVKNESVVFEDSDYSEKISYDDDDDEDDENYKYVEKKIKGSRKPGRPVKKARVIKEFEFVNMFDEWRLKERDLIREKPSVVEERERVVRENHDDALPLKFDEWRLKERDVIREKPVVVEERESVVREEEDHDDHTLPLKFRFEVNFEDDDEDKEVVEKSDRDREIESYFDDLEMGLWESKVVECRDDSSSIIADECCLDEPPMVRCRRGEHDHFLDEQIGVVCRYCLVVLIDIKHVLPPFYVEKQDRKDMEEISKSVMNEVKLESSNSGNLESCNKHSAGSVLKLIPDSSKELYPHQLKGFEFLWQNIAGDTNLENLGRLSSNGGQGCIISHAPGTGKTRLTIVFLQTFMKLYPNCRPVIIAPRGMLLTWEQEIKKWKAGIGFHNLNEQKLSDEENEGVLDQNQKSRDYIRMIKMASWMKGGSVLGIGYRLFEELAGEHERKNKGIFKKVLLEVPNLLVMDEGHTPRNDQTQMWKALTNVKTRRRVILSGTPFQNNFNELYNTLSLVNPRFSHQMIKGKGRGNLGRNDWGILTNSIGKNRANNDGLERLRRMIKPFVHIHKGDILKKTLSGMRDCLVILKPTDLQRKFLEKIARIDNFLEKDHLASLISVHPSLVSKRPEFSDHKMKLDSLKSDYRAGVKTAFLINLVELSSKLGEKVLIFSEFIPPLLHIKSLLKKSSLKWNEGREVLYMDGDITLKQRQRLINSFNDKKGNAKVMLASQRACSEGINLVGASRVVLLDVSWNPQVERQAICRAYRLGQERMVYVYHLVTLMEVKKYERQAEKERISELIFSPGGSGGGSPGFGGGEDKILEVLVSLDSGGSMFERIIHQPKESDWMNSIG